MDRDRIERRDFPTGRRGYDPAAVDEHLRRVADEFESRTPPARPVAGRQHLRAGPPDPRGRRAQRRRAPRRAPARRPPTTSPASRTPPTACSPSSTRSSPSSTACCAPCAPRGERLAEGLAELQSEVAGGSHAAAAASRPPRPPTRRRRSRPPPTRPPPSAGRRSPPPVRRSARRPLPPRSTLRRPLRDPPAADGPRSPPPTARRRPSPPAADGRVPVRLMPADDEAGARLIALNMALGGQLARGHARATSPSTSSSPDLEALLDDVYARAGR